MTWRQAPRPRFPWQRLRDRTFDQLGGERGQPLVLKIRPAILDQEILLLHITRLVQASAQGGCCGLIVGLCRAAEKSEHRRVRLLRARHEWPRGCRAAEQHDEIAAFHSMTSSARARMGSGMDNPIVLAVLRLRTSSNFVACSTGKSAGFAPLKILSMKYAARRYI